MNPVRCNPFRVDGLFGRKPRVGPRKLGPTLGWMMKSLRDLQTLGNDFGRWTLGVGFSDGKPIKARSSARPLPTKNNQRREPDGPSPLEMFLSVVWRN